MPNVFGDPRRGDATSRHDQRVENASRKFVDIVTRLGPNVLNRPIGSKVLSPTEQVQEYQQVYQGNPDAFAQAHQRFVEQHGFLKGTDMYAKWVNKMQAKVRDNSNG